MLSKQTQASPRDLLRLQFSEIARGSKSELLSQDSLEEMQSLKILGMYRFTLTALLEKQLLHSMDHYSEAALKLRIDAVYSQLFQWMKAIANLAPGHERAEIAHLLIDSAVQRSMERLGPNDKISCAAACSFCCLTPVSVTESEKIRIQEYLDSQLFPLSELTKYSGILSDKACPFLSKDQSCQVYAVRPIACRKVNALSEANLCNPARLNSPSYLLDRDVEILAAAFYNVEYSFFHAELTLAGSFRWDDLKGKTQIANEEA